MVVLGGGFRDGWKQYYVEGIKKVVWDPGYREGAVVYTCLVVVPQNRFDEIEVERYQNLIEDHEQRDRPSVVEEPHPVEIESLVMGWKLPGNLEIVVGPSRQKDQQGNCYVTGYGAF